MDLDLVASDLETLAVSETVVVPTLIGDVAVDEFVPVSEVVVVYQDGQIVLPVDTETVGYAETTDAILAAFETAPVEVLHFSEGVIFHIITEPGLVIDHPVEGPPPPETFPPIPAIVAAQYQEDGLVRVFHIDDSESSIAFPDPTTAHGRQLIEWEAEAGNDIFPYVVPTPSGYQVDIERERRISLGIMVVLDSTRPIAMQTRSLEDFRNITFLVTTAASAPINQTFRDAYNIMQTLTSTEMIELGAKLTNIVQEYYEAGWTLKELTDGVPFDYTADMYWPDHSFPEEPPPGYPGA